MHRVRIILLLLLAVLFSCNEEPLPAPTPYPFLVLREISAVSGDGASFEAELLHPGSGPISDYGFLWDQHSDAPTLRSNRKSLGHSPGTTFSYRLSFGIAPDTTYYVRAYARTGSTLTYSNILAFTGKGSLPPEISGFSPEHGVIGTKVRITGKNFGLLPEGNKVHFGTLRVAIDTCNENEIFVTIPPVKAPDSVKISVETAGMLAVSAGHFSVRYPWLRKKDFPVRMWSQGASFSLAGKGYLIAPESQTMFVYDPAADHWSEMGLPVATNVPVAFASQDKGYLLAGTRFFEWDPGQKQWSGKAAFPGVASGHTFGFACGGSVFAGSCHIDRRFWRYDPAADAWSEAAPFAGGFHPSETPWGHFAFTLGEKGYLGISRTDGFQKQFWQYDPVADRWSRKPDFTSEASYLWASMVIGGKVYLGLGDYFTGWAGDVTPLMEQYDPVTEEWKPFRSAPKGLAVYASFSIGGKGYVVGEFTLFFDDRTMYVYQFDPSQEL